MFRYFVIKELAFITCLGIPWFLMCFNYRGFICCLFHITVLFLGISSSLNTYLPERLHRNVDRNLEIQKLCSLNKEERWRVGRKECNIETSFGSSLFMYLLPAWIFVKTMFLEGLAKLRKKEEECGGDWKGVRREEGNWEGMKWERMKWKGSLRHSEGRKMWARDEHHVLHTRCHLLSSLFPLHLERQSFSLKSHHRMVQSCRKQFFSFSISFDMMW